MRRVASAEITFGGLNRDRTQAELTAVPVLFEKRTPPPEKEMDGWFLAKGAPVKVVSSEAGSGEISVVAVRAAAGQRAAVQAAKLGKKVGICEKREVVGGVCINTGTIPSKTFREAVLYLSGFAQRGMYGASYSVKENITVEDLLFRCTAVIKREIEVIRAQMRRNGVTLIAGAAKFTSPHTLTVTGLKAVTEVEADKIVIATGTRPAAPPGVAVDGETFGHHEPFAAGQRDERVGPRLDIADQVGVEHKHLAVQMR